MSHLARQHAQLATMVGLVRHEVVQKVHDIGREVLPRGPRNDATPSNPELEQFDDAGATPRQRPQQLRRANAARVDGPRHGDTMPRAHHLDPHASGIVDVGRDHPHRPAWNAGKGFRPHRGRQVLEEIDRHAIVRSPRSEDGAAGIEICWHVRPPAVSWRYRSKAVQDLRSAERLHPNELCPYLIVERRALRRTSACRQLPR